MEKYLLTASLLDSWRNLLTNEYSKLEDFISVLKREEHKTTEAQQDGINFEAWAVENYEPTLNGQYQVVAYKDFKSDYKTEYVLYGRLDCIKQGRIYDYKHTKNYFCGKYWGRIQTSMYFELCPEINWFEYVIGTTKPNYQRDVEETTEPYNIYRELYLRDEVTPIRKIINQFEQWLRNVGLWETYTTYWKSNKGK